VNRVLGAAFGRKGEEVRGNLSFIIPALHELLRTQLREYDKDRMQTSGGRG
jgi:hypothetical protein